MEGDNKEKQVGENTYKTVQETYQPNKTKDLNLYYGNSFYSDCLADQCAAEIDNSHPENYYLLSYCISG